jgi:anthranilate phosphoribosyltransferase
MSQRRDTEAYIGAILEAKLRDEEAVKLLAHIENTGPTAEQIAGAVDAVMARSIPFPQQLDAIDVCGTGGDYQHTYNISTATALVVAACGVKVAKHGNKAITSQSGSADVLEMLGVHTSLSPQKCEAVLNEVGICFLFAPAFHPGFAAIAPLRKAIGHRTIFNAIGPLCNPARVNRQLIGVYDKKLCKPMAEAAQMLGSQSVIVVHGADGCDEVSITGPSYAYELHEGEILETTIEPKRAGLYPQPIESIKGGDAEENARAMIEIFNGEENGYAQAVILNAAVALYVSGKATALRGGAAMAQEALLSGQALHVLRHLAEASRRP